MIYGMWPLVKNAKLQHCTSFLQNMIYFQTLCLMTVSRNALHMKVGTACIIKVADKRVSISAIDSFSCTHMRPLTGLPLGLMLCVRVAHIEPCTVNATWLAHFHFCFHLARLYIKNLKSAAWFSFCSFPLQISSRCRIAIYFKGKALHRGGSQERKKNEYQTHYFKDS